MSIQLHFSEQDWERLERNWGSWWAGELQRPLVVIESWESPEEAIPREQRHFITHFPDDTPVDDILDFYQTQLEARRFYGDSWPKWWPNFGPGIAAGFLGAQVLTAADTVWFEPAAGQHISNIRAEVDAGNVWWQRVQSLSRTAVARWGDRVCVGFTDIGGNLDILASLLTAQRLATDFYDEPDEVLRLVHKITDAWLHYYDVQHEIVRHAGRGTTQWAPTWSSQRTYMLQSDFSYMISPKMFERFVMPDLAACCDQLDHAFYHLDGKGQLRHLDMMLSIERLRGIQWIPGAGQPPPEEWLPLLHRIRSAGKLCQVYVTPAGARQIVREIGGRGFVLYIDVDYMSAEDADSFLNLLQREDIGETSARLA